MRQMGWVITLTVLNIIGLVAVGSSLLKQPRSYVGQHGETCIELHDSETYKPIELCNMGTQSK